MARTVVIGGGVAGLASAIALSRDGHEVVVLERDAAPLPASPRDAFEAWVRPGAPQLWHSHAFLARLRNLLKQRAPDVLAALLEAGAAELPFEATLPASVRDRSRHPGDDELVLLACRRSTFEWVLRRCVAAERGVVWRGGWSAEGLELEASPAGVPRVRGVRASGPDGARELLAADQVVDAAGRRSRCAAWLRESGAERIEESQSRCGILYSSRFYRLREGEQPPAGQGVVAIDLGYLKYGVFPGDAGTFSVTLAAVAEDAEMRALLRPERFDAVAASLPQPREWIEGRADALGEVRSMADLRNRRRVFAAAERPAVLGCYVVGDAAVCTNPLYGRGCSLAFVHAYLLADALREHAPDLDACALAFDAATRREIDPWYLAARNQDADALEVAAAQRRGEDPFLVNDASGRVDPKAYVRALVRFGLMPLLRTDAAALRRVARGFNLLDPPEDLMRNSDLLPRILASYQQREQRAADPEPGPSRQELVERLRAAA